MNEISNLKNTCFVCREKVTAENSEINQSVFLPVCKACKGTENEKKAIAEQLESLADGLFCGCI